MCIIIVKPANVSLPNVRLLLRSALHNPDGFGFATPEKVFKTTNVKQFFAELRNYATPEKPCIMHFRYATHGSVKDDNCHPFYDDESNVAFFHNGVLPYPSINDKTDSEYCFKNEILPLLRVASNDIENADFLISTTELAKGSRFAMLQNEKIVTIGNYYKHFDKCLYSNMRIFSDEELYEFTPKKKRNNAFYLPIVDW